MHEKKEKKKNFESMVITEYPSNRWQGKLGITTHSNDLVAMIQSPEASKINYGILVHKILGEILSIDEIESTISDLYFQGLFSEEEMKKLEEEIRQLLSVPEVKNFFSSEWSVKTEREIILPDGEILRPDRVLIKGDKAVVIDFKTGKESTAHARQINRYAEILSQMNYKEVEKFIVYSGEKRVVRVE
jgi:ATP-dependent helicase/nuclease subunit A